MRLPVLRRSAPRPSARARLAAQAIVLAAVVAGTSGFAALHKQVVLEVDGSASTVTAFGRTVADVLAGSGVEVAAHDSVSAA
ncbi:MAG TPA: ubiquitin-like domain-containing protein, partial [Actinotalea sp.]|nr:ubiquitin-like domain-containing protein [Actinotalea sp.]